jgi:hypothetical protein
VYAKNRLQACGNLYISMVQASMQMEFIVRFKALPHLLQTKDYAILQDDLPPPSIVEPILEASSGCFALTSNLSVVRCNFQAM